METIYVTSLFVIRLLVPLGIALGVSYLLEKAGIVAHSPHPPVNW
ncbi:MAG: hypothetical protein ACKOC5_01725 [Chloroflexota bacterium]